MTPPGSGFDERVVVIEHDAFRDLWSAELDGGLVVDRDLDLRHEAVGDAEKERLERIELVAAAAAGVVEDDYGAVAPAVEGEHLARELVGR